MHHLQYRFFFIIQSMGHQKISHELRAWHGLLTLKYIKGLQPKIKVKDHNEC